MPGNLLFADINFPTAGSGDDRRDLKSVLNYLYMLREELRYTMGNIGVGNFNNAELIDLTGIIVGSLDIKIQTIEGSLSQLIGRADANEASITLLSRFTGAAGAVTVTSAGQMTDKTKVYYLNGAYYAWNGTAWAVTDKPMSEALASVQAQANANEASVTLLSQFTGQSGVVTVATPAERTDITKVYKVGTTYYRWNGTAWAVMTSPPTTESVAAVKAQADANGSNITSLASTVSGHTSSIASITSKTDANSADISLVAVYNGLGTATTVTSMGQMTDTTKIYKYNNQYYKWSGTAWVGADTVSQAAFILSAINGQSAASMSADRINFTGFTTFARAAELAAGITTISGACIKTGQISADYIGPNNGSFISFGSPLYLDSYYPDIFGIKNLYFGDSNYISCGGGQYDYLMLSSYQGVKIMGTLNAQKIYNAGSMSIDVQNGGGMYISTQSGTTQYVTIGNANSVVRLVGEVYINNVLQ